MRIRTRTGVSVDGFIATPNRVPAFVVMPGFVPHESYGWPEFDEQIDAVVLGRVALDAGLAAGEWPWPGKQIFVLTSRPVPAEVPAEVVVADDSPGAARSTASRGSGARRVPTGRTAHAARLPRARRDRPARAP
jgi:hypothetical protein